MGDILNQLRSFKPSAKMGRWTDVPGEVKRWWVVSWREEKSKGRGRTGLVSKQKGG